LLREENPSVFNRDAIESTSPLRAGTFLVSYFVDI